MKERLCLVVFLCVWIGASIPASAQFTAQEIVERGQWEDFLTTAEIVASKQLSGGTVEISPWRLTLEKKGKSRDAVWKNLQGKPSGIAESWKWEIAAYRLDKYLELNMVPPTVEREFRDNQGCCQLWVTVEMDMGRKIREKIQTPTNRVISMNRAIYLQRAFDNLIANVDRHKGNILLTKDWRLILVDHSRSFGTSKKLTSELIYTEKNTAGAETMNSLPRTFVEKLKAMNPEIIQEIVEDYLTDEEIEALLMRRDLILEEIAGLIAKYGEDNILY